VHFYFFICARVTEVLFRLEVGYKKLLVLFALVASVCSKDIGTVFTK